MEVELSQKAERLCKSLKLTPESMAFADLVAVGWEPQDAFIVAFRKGATWVKRALKEEVEKTLALQQVQDRIAETRRVLSERQKEAVKSMATKERSQVIDTAMSKENMLYDLQTAKSTMAIGSKEWLDTNKLIVDVTRMKQDEVQTEDSTIVYHLPQNYPTGCQDCLYSRCNSCIYKKEYRKGDEKDPRLS